MWMYILICLSLSLAGIASLQFFYLTYQKRIDKDNQKRIRELEIHSTNLLNRLQQTELQLAEQNELDSEQEEMWADVLEEEFK